MATATQPPTIGGLPHGLGLLTTVASLPPKYRARYLHIKTKCERPLDLSVKPISPQIASDVPMATAFTEVYTEPSIVEVPSNNNNALVDTNNTSKKAEILASTSPIAHEVLIERLAGGEAPPTVADETAAIVTLSKLSKVCVKPMTPPLTPTKRKFKVLQSEAAEDDQEAALGSPTATSPRAERFIEATYTNPSKLAKNTEEATTKRESTPAKPIRTGDTAPKTNKTQTATTRSNKNKATRKLKFDEETSSPVSGTIIRPLEDITDGTMQYSNGDIDPRYNIVEITEETKAELAAIKNVIGDYVCKLCRLKFEDAFGLARHRCACIVLLEYRCPECGKQFNCPANLASHRRWHKPKKAGGAEASTSGASSAAAAKKENRNTTNAAQAATATVTVTSTVAVSKKIVTTAAAVSSSDATLDFGCDECGKGFRRLSYLRKHQLTHAKKAKPVKAAAKSSAMAVLSERRERQSAGGATSMANLVRAGSYQSYGGSSSASSSSSSGSSKASSLHSYNGAAEDEDGTYRAGGGGGSSSTAPTSHYEYDADSMSDSSSSSSSAGYGRLQIVEGGLTEEENIAAAALTNLRNCASVIQHTTLAH